MKRTASIFLSFIGVMVLIAGAPLVSAQIPDETSSRPRVFRPEPPRKKDTSKRGISIQGDQKQPTTTLSDVYKINLHGLKLGMAPEEASIHIKELFPNVTFKLEQKKENDGSVKNEFYVSESRRELWVKFDKSDGINLVEYVMRYKRGFSDSEKQIAIQDSVNRYGGFDDLCTQRLQGETTTELLWGSKFKSVSFAGYEFKAPDFDIGPVFIIKISSEDNKKPTVSFILMNTAKNKSEKQIDTSTDKSTKTSDPTKRPTNIQIDYDSEATPFVEAMIDNARDEARLMQAKEKLDRLRKPQKGDSGRARKLNEDALALMKQGKTLEAEPVLEEAHRTDPTDVEIANNLASAYYNNGIYYNDFRKAKTKLVDTLSLRSDRLNAWANMGLLLSKEGDSYAAANCYINYHRFSKSRDKANKYIDNGRGSEFPEVAKAFEEAYQYISNIQAPSASAKMQVGIFGLPTKEPTSPDNQKVGVETSMVERDRTQTQDQTLYYDAYTPAGKKVIIVPEHIIDQMNARNVTTQYKGRGAVWFAISGAYSDPSGKTVGKTLPLVADIYDQDIKGKWMQVDTIKGYWFQGQATFCPIGTWGIAKIRLAE